MVAQGQRDPGMGAGPSPMASQSEPTQRRRFVKMASAWRSLAASLTSARKPTQQAHVPCSVLSTSKAVWLNKRRRHRANVVCQHMLGSDET